MWISSRKKSDGNKPINGKIIQFDSSIRRHQRKAPSMAYNYHLTISTDAGVSFVFDVPIYDICMVSDIANYKACNFPNKDMYIPQLQAIAEAYGDLLKELGITMVAYHIDRDESNDTSK